MQKPIVTFTSAGVALALTLAVLIVGGAWAMDREELRNVPPQVRNWFESMRSPTGKLCCSYADGHRTEYDMRENSYWVPINQVWTQIPPEVVIHDQGNPFSEAVVWYNPIIENGQPTGQHKILCFVPGGGS
jgi:hypothetical protein